MKKPHTQSSPPAGISPILSIRIPAELLNAIDEASKATGISRSTLVRIALKEGMGKVNGLALSIKQG